MNGDLIAVPVALVVVAYHYGITRDVRRTMHRIADALERRSPPASAPVPLVDQDRPRKPGEED